MSHIEHNASEDQTVDYPIPPNYDPLRGALIDIIDLSKGIFPTNARRLGDIHNRARAALGELPITILAQPTPALDVTPTPAPLREAYILGWRDHEAGIAQRPPIALAQPTLDAAWVAAEAALPKGWCDLMLYHFDAFNTHTPNSYGAKTISPNGREVYGYGETPAAALTALIFFIATTVGEIKP